MPAGLVNYKPLVTIMQANVDNYTQVNSLPSFRLFAWFFVIPGLLLVLFSGWGLVVGEGKWFTLPTNHRPASLQMCRTSRGLEDGPESLRSTSLPREPSLRRQCCWSPRRSG